MTHSIDTTQHTAIVTYGRGWPALTITRSLGARGVRVVVGDCVPMAPSRFSRHCAASFRYPDPGQDPEGFMNAIEARVRAERARGGEVVLMPVHSETYLIAEHRERFEAAGARLALPDHADIEATHDKGRLADLAEELGVRIPTTHRFRSMNEVYAAACDVTYPAFVKVRGAAAGVGIQKVDGPEELVTTYREFVEGYELEPDQYPLVQEFVAGSDYCVSALFDRGERVATHTYRNLRQFPADTGAGVLRETVLAPEAEAVVCHLLEHLGWHGLAQLDFRWADGEAPSLIELNPRFFGGLPQAVAAGVDYPWLVFQLALGISPETPEVDPTVRTEVPVLGLLATATKLPGAGSNAARGALLAEHQGTVNDVVRWDDPLPALGALYPLAVFLEHRTLDTAVVLSEARMKTARTVKGLKGHLKPSKTTLLMTALVFLLSVVATTWAVVDTTLVGAAFSLPSQLASAVFPSGGGASYALFHVANFCFLYTLAAGALALRERVQVAREEQTRGAAA
jgi:predicted ATP-grasp superfamily ATP-dependent carboligase